MQFLEKLWKLQQLKQEGVVFNHNQTMVQQKLFSQDLFAIEMKKTKQNKKQKNKKQRSS